MRPPCRPRPITAVCGARRCAGRPGAGAQRSMARHYATRDFFRQMPNPLLARYFHARGVFADLDIAALPEPPARRAVGGLADAGRHPAPRDGRRVPGHRGAEWRERLPRHPRRRGVALRNRPGGPRGLRRAARLTSASWRVRDDDVPRPSRLLAARRALLSRGGVARLAQAHPSAARARGGGRGESPGPRRRPQHVLPPHRGPGYALRRGTVPSGHAGLFLRLPRGLLAAACRMGGRPVRTTAAPPGLRGHLRLFATGRHARPERPRRAHRRRTVAGACSRPRSSSSPNSRPIRPTRGSTT